MSNTLYTFKVAITVYDTDHLPEGVYPDDVLETFRGAMQDHATRLYHERGYDQVMACEPDVI